MIEVLVDNRLRIHHDGLPADLRAHLEDVFTHKNPAHGKLAAMGHRYNSEPEFYYMARDEGDHFTLPRGGMQRLRDAFDEFDLDYQVDDRRSMGNPFIVGSYVDGWQLGLDLFPEHKLVAWDHQLDIVSAGMQFGQALIRSPTGSGKTSALLKLITETQVPSLVIMWDSGLLKQWQERIESELGIPPADQGLIRGKTFRLKPITLAMQQTLNRWDDEKWQRMWYFDEQAGLWRSVFGGVYCDEVQRYAATTFTKQIDRFDCHFRVGVSADERRKDGKTFIIYDMFGPVRHEVKKKDLVEKRIIHEVECYVVPTQFDAPWFRMKKEDDLLELSDYQRLTEEMMEDDERNALAVHLIEECVREGLPTLAFTQYVDHARRLDVALTGKGIASGLALGGPEWEDVFNETVQQLRDGQLQVGCGTFGKLGVGHDIPTIAAGLAVTPVHNNRGFLGQVKGRICRTTAGKQNARILVMWDRLVFGDAPLFNLKRWNEVCRVWCEWDRRWKDIGDYLKENRHGNRTGQGSAATAEEGIFQSAQRRG